MASLGRRLWSSLVLVIVAASATAVGSAGSPDGAIAPDAGAATNAEGAPPGRCPSGMAYVPARALRREHGPAAIVPATHAFCMDILETTHADYAACVKAKACSPLRNEAPWAGRPRYPVLRATFAQAHAYCGFRRKRVPSPNEWIRAAAGDDERWHPWGQMLPPDRREVCAGRGHPCNVGTSVLDVTPFGIRDMAANAEEWVLGVRGPHGDMGGDDWVGLSLKTLYIGKRRSWAGIRCASDPTPPGAAEGLP